MPSVRQLMLICIIFDAQEDLLLRTTITIDDELYQRALDVADPGMDKADLFREAIRVFCARSIHLSKAYVMNKFISTGPITEPCGTPLVR